MSGERSDVGCRRLVRIPLIVNFIASGSERKDFVTPPKWQRRSSAKKGFALLGPQKTSKPCSASSTMRSRQNTGFRLRSVIVHGSPATKSRCLRLLPPGASRQTSNERGGRSDDVGRARGKHFAGRPRRSAAEAPSSTSPNSPGRKNRVSWVGRGKKPGLGRPQLGKLLV